MATKDELYEAVKETLEHEGVLRKVKAQVQSEVTRMLFESVPSSQQPPVPEDVSLVNALIKQYLEWIGFNYTIPIFNTESGCTREFISQEKLARKLNMKLSEKTMKLPLLYTLVQAAKEKANNDEE